MGWNRLSVGEDVEGHRHRRHHRLGRTCTACCIGLCTCFVFVVLSLGLAILIAWLALDRPRSTHYNIVSASVPTLSVAGDTNDLLSNSQINSEFTFGLQARNPNGRVTIEYQKFNVHTSFLGVELGYSSVPGFRVGKKSSQITAVTTQGEAVGVSNIVGTALKAEINQKTVTVRVKVDMRVRARVGSYKSFWIWLHRHCRVTVTPPDQGNVGTLISSDCD